MKGAGRGRRDAGAGGTGRDPAGGRVGYAEEGPFGRFVRVMRHPLRVLAMGLAAFAMAWGIVLTEGLVSAVIGAVAGVVCGELLGRSRLRLSVVLGTLFVLMLLSWGAASLSTGTELIPSLTGPGGALRLSGVLRWGSFAFALTAALRASAVRRPAVLGLELAFVVIAIAAMLAAHREGVIARPLWLSDWAWQKGIDPADVFMTVGGVAAVLLAVLLVLETRGGRSVSSLVTLPVLALLAVACLDVVGRPTPQVDDGIGLTDDDPGDAPEYTPPEGDPPDHGGGGDGEGDGGGAPPPGTGDGGVPVGQGDGGSSAQSTDADGGAGGRGDGGGDASARDGGAGGGGGDASADGGGAAGDGDGGASSGQADGGDGGSSSGREDGGGSGAGSDGGADAASGAEDAGTGTVPDGGFPPPPPQNGGQGGQGEQSGPPQTQQELDDTEGPSNSPAPMAVVVLENDYSPPSQTYYFRQEAWSQFNGTRLVPSTLDGADPDMLGEFPTRSVAVSAPPPGDRQVVRATVSMLVEHQHPFALESPVRFEPMANPNADRFVRSYRFESLAQVTGYQELLGREAGNPEWSEEVRAAYLEGHPDPRFAEVMEEILAELPEQVRDDPFARALTIKLYLDRELIYSTGHRHADAEDPTVDFFFGNRIGYCVHFAHTAAFLYRAAGVPARVGTGYAVAEENRRGGSAVLVRSGDAHAWPEIYLADIGWVVLDIAAERNLDEPGQPLDEDLQRMLGEMAREQPADPQDEVEDDDDGGTEFPIDFWTLALILAGLVLVSLYGVKAWRRIGPLFATGRTVPRVGYRAMLDRFAEVGLSREYGETREQFADRIAEIAPSFQKMTALHVAARLGNPEAPPASRPELSTANWRVIGRAVRRELRAGTRLWRRLLGLLHPVSFLDSR